MAVNTENFEWFRYFESLIGQSEGKEVPECFDWEAEGFKCVGEFTTREENDDWWHTIYVYQRGKVFIAREWHETRYSASYDNEYEGGAIWIDMEA